MKFPVRLIAASALVVGMGLAVAVPGGVAAAKTKQVTGKCTSLSGNESTQTLSGCNDTADTGGGGTIATNTTAGTYTTTWDSGLTSTGTETYKEKFGKSDKCPAMSGYSALAEADATSVDTGGTATDLIGTKHLKSVACAYEDSMDNIIVENYPGKTIPF